MNSSPLHSLRQAFFGVTVALLCALSAVAQAPKGSTTPAQAANRYMATITRFHKAIGTADAKTIVDISYYHQNAIRQILQGQPQAVWPQLRDAYYKSVSAQMASQPDTLAALRESIASMDGDPAQNIRMIRAFLPPSATLTFLEQRPINVDAFPGIYVFVGVTYPNIAASPISNISFIKYIILRFMLTRDTALISSVSTVPASIQLHTKPYPQAALGYVESVFFTKYLSVYDDPNLWKSMEQEALSIGNDFAIQLYTSIAQSHPTEHGLWPDPRGAAVQVLSRLQYKGLNALLVPLITPPNDTGYSSKLTVDAVNAVLPPSGNRSDEPTATLRQELMDGLAIQTIRGPAGRTSTTYLDALSRLDGQPWGPMQLYMPQPPGANQKNLYVKLFDGLLSADADRYIDLSSANATAFAKIIGTLVKCSDRNSMFYHMNGCKTDLALETNTAKVIDNGRIQCTATITDTSHTFSTSATNTLLYRVEMILVPQGQPSNDWKVVGAKIESHTPASAVQSAGGGAISTDEQLSKLSGHWRLTSESNGKLPSPKVYILQVDGPAITIGAPGGGKGIHYIDGRPSVYPSGSTVSSSTRWSGGVLVIDISSSSSNGTATQFRVSYSVSNDARTLTRHLQQLAAGRTVLENIAVYSKE